MASGLRWVCWSRPGTCESARWREQQSGAGLDGEGLWEPSAGPELGPIVIGSKAGLVKGEETARGMGTR